MRSKWASATLAASVAAIVIAGCSRELPQDVAANLKTASILREDLSSGEAAAAGGAAALADPTGWGTLRGVFRLQGSPPQLAALSVAKDQQVCGTSAPNESVVVSSDGGIKNIVVFLTTEIPDDSTSEAPKWVHADYAATREDDLIYDQEKCVFLSHVMAMRSTQKLRILNSDPVGHNTNIAPTRGARSFNQTIAANTGETAAPVYEPGGAAPQPFPVSCSIHPWMSAWLLTRDDPYFAVTADDGTFEIPNVPAGVELEFRVWQETAGFLQPALVNGQPSDWSRGRFTMTLEPDQSQQLEVVVDASTFQ